MKKLLFGLSVIFVVSMFILPSCKSSDDGGSGSGSSNKKGFIIAKRETVPCPVEIEKRMLNFARFYCDENTEYKWAGMDGLFQVRWSAWTVRGLF